MIADHAPAEPLPKFIWNCCPTDPETIWSSPARAVPCPQTTAPQPLVMKMRTSRLLSNPGKNRAGVRRASIQPRYPVPSPFDEAICLPTFCVRRLRRMCLFRISIRNARNLPRCNKTYDGAPVHHKVREPFAGCFHIQNELWSSRLLALCVLMTLPPLPPLCHCPWDGSFRCRQHYQRHQRPIACAR